MSRYTADSRDRVRDAVDMLALVGTRVELRRTGVNSYFGCCPFHDERTPSFHVRPDEKHYHCFGCSESGDPFDFVMQTEGLDFKGALESLADRFGVTLQTEEEDPGAAAARQRRERLYALLHRTATFYARVLWESREASSARDYLRERGFSEEILREFLVGYAPDAWDRVRSASLGAGYTEAELAAAGLSKESRSRPGRSFDFFRGKVMFPTCDPRGRVRGFGARRMGEQAGPKYVNTPDGELYHKREVLYGIHLARATAARAGRMILVEGYTDVMALHQAGVRNAVGIMGTSLTREQVAELVKVVRVLELCLDADAAGEGAAVRAASVCAGSGLELRVIALPPGTDPGDMIRTGGPEALADLVKGSVPYVAFEVGRVLDHADLETAEGKDLAIAGLRPALAGLGPSVLRDELVRKAAGRLGLDEARFLTLLGGSGTSGGGLTGPPPSRAAVPARVLASVEFGVRSERAFLAMCLAAGPAGEEQLARLDPDRLLTSALLRRAARALAGQTEVAEDDEELDRCLLSLRAAADGRVVSAEELEHARLLLELADADRQITRARAERLPGVAELAGRRQAIRAAIAEVTTRIEKAH